MQSMINTGSFEAFRTPTGILIKELKNNAFKMGIIIAVVGIVFIGIGLLDLSNSVSEILNTIFHYVFFWGGILLLVLGALTAVLKGMVMNTSSVEFDSTRKVLKLRGKEIPYAEIDRFILQTQDMMGKKMTFLLFEQQGKKKGFIPGSMLVNDVSALEQFVNELNHLIRQ